MKIKAEIVADSLNPQGDRLTSLLITFPRIILAEVNTHRMLSKNTSSSRAIPFRKMVESVENDPFIPIAWQKPHKGMQGTEYYDHTLTEEVGGLDYTNLIRRWLRARDTAVSMAKIMTDEIGNMPVTKQLANRLLEPFMWTTMLITGSQEGWDNFFELRCPQYEVPYTWDKETKVFRSRKDAIKYWKDKADKDKTIGQPKEISEIRWFELNKGQAEIHMMALAEAIYDVMNESKPRQLKGGEWHIPFEDKISFVGNLTNSIDVNNTHWNDYYTQNKVKISTAMAARTSYTVVGDEKEINYEKMIELHDRLISQNPPHSSPMEHCARAMDDEEYYSWIKGKVPTSTDDYGIYNSEYYPVCYKESIDFGGTLGENPNNGDKFGWCRNFKGFIPYRHIIESQKRV